MVKIKVIFDKPITINRKDFDYGSYYWINLSRKNANGSYMYASMPIRFKGEVDFENKTKVEILDAFITFYEKKDKTNQIYIMVMDYKMANEEDKFETIKMEDLDYSDELPF